MTGDPRETSHTGSAQQGTTTGGAAAGWYADPGEPSQLRYYDGARWTTHVAPRPAPVPAYAGTAPTVLPPSSAAVLPSPAAWPTHVVASSPDRRAVSTTRILIGVAVVLVGLMGLGGVLRGLTGARDDLLRAPGAPLTLSTVAPETVVGRSPNTSKQLEAAREQSEAMLRSSWRTIPGSTPAKVEVYGPGPESAPARGDGILMLAWTGTSKLFSQDDAARGFANGALAKSAGTATTTASQDGGLVVCTESVQPQVGPMTICAWIRSGTGLVLIIEYAVEVDVVRDDLGVIVAQMTHP